MCCLSTIVVVVWLFGFEKIDDCICKIVPEEYLGVENFLAVAHSCRRQTVLLVYSDSDSDCIALRVIFVDDASEVEIAED